LRNSRTFFSDFPKSFHFGVEKVLTARNFVSRSPRRPSFPIMRSPQYFVPRNLFNEFFFIFQGLQCPFFHSPSWLRIEFVFGLNPSLSEHGSPQQAGNCIRTLQGTPGPSHCRPRGLLTILLFFVFATGGMRQNPRFNQVRPGSTREWIVSQICVFFN
jgi:hypothetical protein